ncbi:unnamed protein product [Phytomonas sp. Hart1]|nr:unnamed protein product [Phytomonas sp. Hart1]|eukprot:CCW69784.1 unnamed protein product [Phytomonas sp. isolate Hart1]
MEYLADKCLENGDLTSASDLFTSLEKTNPKYAKMARICRVLSNPTSVPLPHRHHDMCEALLDPLITSRILLRGTPSVESIRKYYQQLIVHVHPDKNPTPCAKEAFLRLGVLQVDALRYFENNQKEAASLIPHKPPAAGKGRKKGKGPTEASVTSRMEEDMTNLFHVRKNQITLKSLKRKEIAKDFQIFSAPRQGPYPPAGERNREPSSNPGKNPPPRRKANPPRRNRRQSEPQTRHIPSNNTTITTLEDSFSPASDLAARPEAIPDEKISLDGEEAEVESVENIQSYLSGDPAEELISDMDSPLGESFSQENGGYKEIREQITTIIEALHNRRFHKAPVRLACDLSFAAYERLKNEAHLRE